MPSWWTSRAPHHEHSSPEEWIQLPEHATTAAGGKRPTMQHAKASGAASASLERTVTAEGDAGRDGTTTEEMSRPNTSEPMLSEEGAPRVQYRTYKRRWFVLVQLILLNIIVSWDWITYAPISLTAATFFSVSSYTITLLSVVFLFAFLVAAPAAHWALHLPSPKLSVIISAVLIFVGNWIRYGSTRASPPSFAGTMIGQILIGLAQPFVLAAPTRFSDLWFSPRGRVAATAAASLANPFGGAVGSLVSPFLATSPAQVPQMTLVVAGISTAICIPSFFIPGRPPTPVSPSSDVPRPPLAKQLRLLLRNPTFWLVAAPYGVYVGLFNSFSSLLTLIMTPYGFTEEEAGIAGAVLILVGLVAAAISSPLVDRYKTYLPLIKVFVPLLATAYLAFYWAPRTRALAAPYVLCAAIGATSFCLVPVVLEWAVEVTYPVGPELSSVLFWSAGQALGAAFTLISLALADDEGSNGEGEGGRPAGNLDRALIFQAVLAWVVVPLVFLLGVVGSTEAKRLGADKTGTRNETGAERGSGGGGAEGE